MPRRRGRGYAKSKYGDGNNLHVINSSGFLSIPTKKVEDPKNSDSQAKKSKTGLNTKTLDQAGKVRKDDGATKKDDAARNKESTQPRKDNKRNVNSHYLSNFLALSQSDKALPKLEIKKHSQYFKNKQSSSEIASSSKESIKEIPNVFAPQKFSKAIPTPTTKHEFVHNSKKKPDGGKKFEYFHKDRDLRFLPPPLRRKSPVKEKYFPTHPIQLKGSIYHDFEFFPKKEDKLKVKPGPSKKFKSLNTKDSSFWKKERHYSRNYLPSGKEAELRKISKGSSEYLDRERYYKNKSHRYEDMKKGYKWQKLDKNAKSSKYSWYNKDYSYKKKYADIPHFSKKYYDYPKDERDLNLEDYEEVASLEDTCDEPKVPVHFRKCLVRYLPYTVYNYFRPKWYYLSRKRYVVNCLYASGKNGNISEKELEVITSPEEVVEDEEIVENAALVDEEMVEDAALVDENEETIEDAALVDNKEGTVEDGLVVDDNEEIGDALETVGDNDETVEDASLVDDNEEIGDGVETVDEALLNDNIETNDKTLLVDNGETIKDALLGDNNQETIEDALLDDDREETIKDMPANDNVKENQSIPDNSEKTENVSANDNTITTEEISTVRKEATTEIVLVPQNEEAIVQGSTVHDELEVSDDISIVHVGPKVKDTICIVIDDQKERDDISTMPVAKKDNDVSIAHNNKDKVDSSIVHDNKEKVDVSLVQHDPIDDDICIVHENVTKPKLTTNRSVAKCVKKFNEVQKQANRVTQNYLKLQQISSKKVIPNKNSNASVKKKASSTVSNKELKESTASPIARSNQDDKQDPNNKKLRVFHKCISTLEFSSEFKQGDSAIQSYLSEWESHLIGLEYMLEVQDDADEKVIKKYYCGLCVQDFPNHEGIEQVVISHIISYKHMCNYMAEHFPSSDFNFSESVRSYVNEIMLQTCCEEINDKLGCHFMCVVKENYFQKEYDKIKEHFSAMKHWGESDIDIFPTIIVNQLESDVCKDVTCAIEDIMNKISPAEPKETFFIPQTIVSSSRRLNPKDKMKDIMKTSESVINRSSQNTLIVLTPSVKVSPVKSLSSSAESVSPKKLASTSTKPSEDAAKGVIQEELPAEEGKTRDVIIDSNSDKDSNSNVEQYRVQDSESVPSPGAKQDGVRIVRLRTSHNRPLELEDSDEEKEVGLLDASFQESVEIDPSNEGDGVANSLQAEDISDNDFSDVDLVEVDNTAPKSQKQLHKKSTHSRYCHKRKAWIKSDSLQTVGELEESSFRNLHSPGSAIPTIGKPSKRYSSHFHKKYDERSQDSFASSTSKRRRKRSRSSSSPSLEEFLRKLSPSPVRKRSPLRVPRTYWNKAGMARRHSRSPYGRRSRSPTLRHSRSPYRKRSKSPIRRRSKSPIRRRSRSPYRKQSRSPVRRRSKSPFKIRSRSPFNIRSRSPVRKRSRSPIRKRSRSPLEKISRSPVRRRSRSPYSGFKSNRNDRSLRSPTRRSGGYRISRSPDKPHVKLPAPKYSRSPSRLHTRPRSPFADPRRDSRTPGSYKSTSSSILPHHHSKTELRKEGNDLEEVSDEDESKYFSTNTSGETPKYMEIIKNLPEAARIMLVKVLQRFSITNINPNDPSFYELMKFVASHSSEIQRLMSQPSALPEINTQVPSNPSAQSQESFLHQYILTGMKGNLQMPIEAGPSTSNAFPGPSSINFQQPPPQTMAPSPQYLSSRPDFPLLNQFGQPVYQQFTSPINYPMQGMHPNVVPQQQQLPMNVPITQQPTQFQHDAYKQASPPKPTVPPPQPKRSSAVMFKDLKATVSKIFGGDDALAKLGKLGIKIPGLNDHPVDAKYSGSSQNVQQINAGYQTSPHDSKSGLYNKSDASTRVSDNFTKSYTQKEGAFLSETTRETHHVPPPDAKVSFCDVQRAPIQRNLFPVVNNPSTSYRQDNVQASVTDAKKSLAQRLAAVLVKVGMVDVPAHLLQEMLMKIGAFSMNPPQDISEGEILTILRKLKYV